MTYEGLFAKCRTVGECRLMKVTQLDKATSDIQRLEIENAYKERVWEIRDSRIFWDDYGRYDVWMKD